MRERFLVALAPDHRLTRRSRVRLADLGDDDLDRRLEPTA